MESKQEPTRIDARLLAMLVCPVDHAELRLEGQELICTQCGERYPIEDGIPNMLPPSDR